MHTDKHGTADNPVERVMRAAKRANAQLTFGIAKLSQASSAFAAARTALDDMTAALKDGVK